MRRLNDQSDNGTVTETLLMYRNYVIEVTRENVAHVWR